MHRRPPREEGLASARCATNISGCKKSVGSTNLDIGFCAERKQTGNQHRATSSPGRVRRREKIPLRRRLWAAGEERAGGGGRVIRSSATTAGWRVVPGMDGSLGRRQGAGRGLRDLDESRPPARRSTSTSDTARTGRVAGRGIGVRDLTFVSGDREGAGDYSRGARRAQRAFSLPAKISSGAVDAFAPTLPHGVDDDAGLSTSR